MIPRLPYHIFKPEQAQRLMLAEIIRLERCWVASWAAACLGWACALVIFCMLMTGVGCRP